MLMALAVNRWTKEFFDALQARQMDAIIASIEQLAILALGMGLVAVATQQCRMRLQLAWRLWLTSRLVERWLNSRMHSDRAVDDPIDNPEARIAEDGRIAVELFVDITGGVINTFLLSASFVIVLWQVGGAFEFHGAVVHGYLVVAVVLYTGMTSLGMWMLAKPLVASVEGKAAAEGDFRYALTHARDEINVKKESSGSVGRDFSDYLTRLTKKWIRVIYGQTKMIALTSSNNVLAPAIPLVLGAPKFLAGEMTLGDLMQAAAAFMQVQVSLNWLADNALNLANWSASAHRVAALDFALNQKSVEADG
jgi:putative ATP-binding cassette transporter